MNDLGKNQTARGILDDMLLSPGARQEIERRIRGSIENAKHEGRFEALEALKPFARAAKFLDEDYADYADTIFVFQEITHGDFRNAAKLYEVLSKPNPNTPERNDE